MFSVFPISPSGIGNYRNWSIKGRGAYFIFHVKGAAPIRERRLFQLHVKQKGECRENSELGKKKDKYAHLELLQWFRKFPYIKFFRTH